MKLFRVEIERTIFVVADDECQVYLDASEHEREAQSDSDADYVHVTEVTKLNDITADWRNALPYGAEDDRKTVDYLPLPEEPFVDLTPDMFA